ncbi:MAG: carboxypeptidase-like regulatory domain-containing protein [Methanomassiliicoccales archaeon]
MKDKSGGIEGLPLQLLIMVLVAGIGSAIIVGWMGGLEAPQAIGAIHSSASEIILQDGDGDGIYSAKDLELIITVLDQEGDPVTGAAVVIEGCGLKEKDGHAPHGVTDNEGKVHFKGLTASRYGNSVGFITITVAKSGMSASKSIMVPVVCT